MCFVTAGTDRKVRQWDTATSQPIGAPFQANDNLWTVAYSPDGKRLVTASQLLEKAARDPDHDEQGGAQQWDAATGRPVGTPLNQIDAVAGATYSPDGKRILTFTGREFGPGAVQQWDASSGQAVGLPLRQPAGVHDAVYSPGGERIAIAGNDKTVQLWDATACQPVSEPFRHLADVNRVAYSPDALALRR